jgi:hypothetical protein
MDLNIQGGYKNFDFPKEEIHCVMPTSKKSGLTNSASWDEELFI